mgnify:CR=1 FL=1
MSVSPPPSPLQNPRRRHLRGGYIASLVCLAVTLVVLAILLAVGPEVRQPAPHFITDPPKDHVQFELELTEEQNELGVFGRSGGACSTITPSGQSGDFQTRGASRYTYGAQEWSLVQILHTPEAGTYKITCTSARGEIGIASMDVVNNAPTRQMVWALTWVTLPALGLVATIVLAVVTRVRDRRDRAAEQR